MESCTDRNGDKWDIYQSTTGWIKLTQASKIVCLYDSTITTP